MEPFTITSIASLFPGQPWKTIFLCLVIISFIYKTHGLKNDLFKLVNILFSFIRSLVLSAKNEFENVTACIDPATSVPIKKNTNKFSTWLIIGMFSLYTSYVLLLGSTTALLAVLKNHDHNNLLIMNISLVFFFVLSLMGYYFRGCAHKAARENGINLTPWRRMIN